MYRLFFLLFFISSVRAQINALASVLEFADYETDQLSVLERPEESKFKL